MRQPENTFSLVCDTCKILYLCGIRQHLFSGAKVGEFLLEHFGHELRYLNDLAPDPRAMSYGAWKHGTH